MVFVIVIDSVYVSIILEHIGYQKNILIRERYLSLCDFATGFYCLFCIWRYRKMENENWVRRTVVT
ncbi:hypothetical protein JOD02_001115 [Caldicoprobacter guelmensis]|nr:hypothetical protein [Caldicoprobacter guelmensis]